MTTNSKKSVPITDNTLSNKSIELYSSANPQNSNEAFVVIFHSLLLESGFIPQDGSGEVTDTSMPKDWRGKGVFKIKYAHFCCPSFTCCVAYVPLYNNISIHGVVCDIDCPDSIYVKVNLKDYMKQQQNFSSISVFRNVDELSRYFKDNFVLPLLNLLHKTSGCHLFGFPGLFDELKVYILQLLPVESVISMSAINKDFHDLANSSFLWKGLYARDFGKDGITDVATGSKPDWKQLYVKEYLKKKRKAEASHFLFTRYYVPQFFHVGPDFDTGIELKVALIQFAVSTNKEHNVERICKFINEAAEKGAKLVCLPECFNAPYGIRYFNEYAEDIPGYTSTALSQSAKKNNIYLVGGSFPEKNDGKLFNTCLVYGPNGELLAKHRKVHLFDIDIPGKITFKESLALSPGNSLTMFNLDKWKIGIGICYDIRFPLMANIYAEKGCQLLVYPGSFNMTTGPAHWELLQKARAVDNQLYVAGVSPARDEKSSYVSWGHTSLISPWGDVVCAADEKEKILYADLDLSYVDDIRAQIPIRQQQRKDLYSFQCIKDF